MPYINAPVVSYKVTWWNYIKFHLELPYEIERAEAKDVAEGKVKIYSAFEIWESIPNEDKENKAHKKEWVNIKEIVQKGEDV